MNELLKNIAMCAYLESTPTPVFRQVERNGSTCAHYLSIWSQTSPSPQLSAFPLHLHILSTVETTNLHLCESEHMECALAHPYAPTMCCLCGCTLPLSFQNNTISPLIHASHRHFTLITAWPYIASHHTLYLIWLSHAVKLSIKRHIGDNI